MVAWKCKCSGCCSAFAGSVQLHLATLMHVLAMQGVAARERWGLKWKKDQCLCFVASAIGIHGDLWLLHITFLHKKMRSFSHWLQLQMMAQQCGKYGQIEICSKCPSSLQPLAVPTHPPCVHWQPSVSDWGMFTGQDLLRRHRWVQGLQRSHAPYPRQLTWRAAECYFLGGGKYQNGPFWLVFILPPNSLWKNKRWSL